MNAANLCPAPASVIDATVRAAADVDGDVSFQNRAKYDELRESVRARLARYLGAQLDEIAIVRNTSEANNIIVGGVPIGAGDEVVISDLNHPTNNVAWDVRARRYGFAVRRVTFPATPANAQQIVSAFEAALSARTKVLSFTDVSNSTGVRMPTAALCALGRDRGIHVHVDGAQTFGGLLRNLAELGCASYSASSHKWFMGPKEAGVLYVRNDRTAAIWPGVVGVGWGSGPETELAGARRFETLGQRNDATIAGMAAALDFHELIGAERVEARMLAVAGALCDGLASIPGARLITSPDAELRAGVCIVSFEGVQPRELHETIYSKHAIAGAPTGGLRLSPHIYNTLDDVERAVQAVRELVA
jgi:selenocysteine lyase/cysteine desulfurase